MVDTLLVKLRMKPLFSRTLGVVAAGVFLLAGTTVWAHSHGHGTTHGDAHAAMASAAGLPKSATVSARDCWIRQLPAPTPSGGFLVVSNSGDQPVTLTGVSSPDYGMVMLHQTTEENGMSKMSMIHEVAIPAGGHLELRPGSYHIMLEQPKDGLKVGDHVQVDFALGNGEGFAATCELKPPKAMSH